MPSVWVEKGRGIVLQYPVCSVYDPTKLWYSFMVLQVAGAKKKAKESGAQYSALVGTYVPQRAYQKPAEPAAAPIVQAVVPEPIVQAVVPEASAAEPEAKKVR